MTLHSGTRRGAYGSIASKAVVLVILGVAAAYFLVPLWWLIVAATKSQGAVVTTNGLWFSDIHLWSNLHRLLARDDALFARWMLNSVMYATIGSLLATLASSMAGYCLARFTFLGRRVLFTVVLGAVLVPATALALPLFLMFARLHLVDTVWAVILPSIVNPFGVYLAYIFTTAAVPTELVEAGRVDGAGEFRIFFSIVQRLILPGLVTIMLFSFVAIWNNFFLPLIMLQSERLYPVTLGLYFWNSQSRMLPDVQVLVTAGSLVSILPLVAAFLLLQKYWRAGLAAGAVRG